MSPLIQHKFLWYSISFWNLQQMYCLERINGYLINLSPLRGPFLNNTMIRKLSKENLKKVLNNRRDQSHFATETAKMQKWTDEAFTTSKWIVTISIISSFCIDCWCFLRRLSPVSKAMLPVTSTPWKPSVRVVRAIHPSNSWGQK